MAKPLFPQKAFQACKNCVLGRPSFDGKRILCIRRGVVDPDYSCRKYKYNPLKRIPRRNPILPTFDRDEFKL